MIIIAKALASVLVFTMIVTASVIGASGIDIIGKSLGGAWIYIFGGIGWALVAIGGYGAVNTVLCIFWE